MLRVPAQHMIRLLGHGCPCAWRERGGAYRQACRVGYGFWYALRSSKASRFPRPEPRSGEGKKECYAARLRNGPQEPRYGYHRLGHRIRRVQEPGRPGKLLRGGPAWGSEHPDGVGPGKEWGRGTAPDQARNAAGQGRHVRRRGRRPQERPLERWPNGT
jgi:hypothetical protein